MDFEEGKEKTCEIEKTKKFVQSVLDRRRLRLNLPSLTSHSAPTSPASNVSEFDYVWDEKEARSIKRRREDTEGNCEEEISKAPAALATKVRRIIRDIGIEIRGVDNLVKGRNIKRKIKDAASALKSMMSQLQTSEVQALLQSMGRQQGGGEQANEDLEERICRLEKTNKELQEENKALKEEVKEMARNGGKRKMKSEFFINGGTYEEFIEAEEMEWPENIDTAVYSAPGPPLRANKETDLLFLQEENQENAGTMCEYLERYPDLSDIEGKVGAILVTTKKINDQGAMDGYDRWMYKIEVEEDGKDFLESLMRLRHLMQKGGRKKVAVYPPGWDVNAKRTRKMLEWAFRTSGIKCLLHMKKKRGGAKSTN